MNTKYLLVCAYIYVCDIFQDNFLYKANDLSCQVEKQIDFWPPRTTKKADNT